MGLSDAALPAGRALLGGPPTARRARARAAAGRAPRRRPLGRGDAARPGRAPRGGRRGAPPARRDARGPPLLELPPASWWATAGARRHRRSVRWTTADAARMVEATCSARRACRRPCETAIVDAAAGNPLFVRAAHLDAHRRAGRIAATSDGAVAPCRAIPSVLAIPPTIEALLAARVDDAAAPRSAAVLEPASVIGGDFARDGRRGAGGRPVAARASRRAASTRSIERQMVRAGRRARRSRSTIASTTR